MAPRSVFTADPDFCTFCGSIIFSYKSNTEEQDACGVCNLPIVNDFNEVTYTIHFNDLTKTRKGKEKGKNNEEKAEGPMVDRDCRECGHNQMSYATLQLRSADEGQTVFYTCPKCKFKESENS